MSTDLNIQRILRNHLLFSLHQISAKVFKHGYNIILMQEKRVTGCKHGISNSTVNMPLLPLVGLGVNINIYVFNVVHLDVGQLTR